MGIKDVCDDIEEAVDNGLHSRLNELLSRSSESLRLAAETRDVAGLVLKLANTKSDIAAEALDKLGAAGIPLSIDYHGEKPLHVCNDKTCPKLIKHLDVIHYVDRNKAGKVPLECAIEGNHSLAAILLVGRSRNLYDTRIKERIGSALRNSRLPSDICKKLATALKLDMSDNGREDSSSSVSPVVFIDDEPQQQPVAKSGSAKDKGPSHEVAAGHARSKLVGKRTGSAVGSAVAHDGGSNASGSSDKDRRHEKRTKPKASTDASPSSTKQERKQAPRQAPPAKRSVPDNLPEPSPKRPSKGAGREAPAASSADDDDNAEDSLAAWRKAHMLANGARTSLASSPAPSSSPELDMSCGNGIEAGPGEELAADIDRLLKDAATKTKLLEKAKLAMVMALGDLQSAYEFMCNQGLHNMTATQSMVECSDLEEINVWIDLLTAKAAHQKALSEIMHIKPQSELLMSNLWDKVRAISSSNPHKDRLVTERKKLHSIVTECDYILVKAASLDIQHILEMARPVSPAPADPYPSERQENYARRDDHNDPEDPAPNSNPDVAPQVQAANSGLNVAQQEDVQSNPVSPTESIVSDGPNPGEEIKHVDNNQQPSKSLLSKLRMWLQ